MITVFERIPDLFVELYDFQFQTWAREFRTRGKRCAIEFQRVPGQAVLLGPDGKPAQVGCWLEAEVDRSRPQEPRVVIKPATEHDEEMIAKHCRAMRGHVLQ